MQLTLLHYQEIEFHMYVLCSLNQIFTYIFIPLTFFTLFNINCKTQITHLWKSLHEMKATKQWQTRLQVFIPIFTSSVIHILSSKNDAKRHEFKRVEIIRGHLDGWAHANTY